MEGGFLYERIDLWYDSKYRKSMEENMAINKTVRKILKAFSFQEIEVESARQIANLKSINPMKIFHKTIDFNVRNQEYNVPVRLFFPRTTKRKDILGKKLPVLIFFHGGGWVTDSIDNYERICALMADTTKYIVISVEYRLAPEYKFPTGLLDCYAVAKEVFENPRFDKDKVTIMGDSAGGNLAAAVCQMARDKKEFQPQKQILIYPVVGNDYTETSPFPSVAENGRDYLLTAGKMQDYIDLYKRTDEDKQNPYFAPILQKDLRGLPKTLVITSEFDPLRDEGEAYARRLKEAGNEVSQYRIKDALHGFFGLGIKYYHVEESFKYINQFLEEE